MGITCSKELKVFFYKIAKKKRKVFDQRTRKAMTMYKFLVQ